MEQPAKLCPRHIAQHHRLEDRGSERTQRGGDFAQLGSGGNAPCCIGVPGPGRVVDPHLPGLRARGAGDFRPGAPRQCSVEGFAIDPVGLVQTEEPALHKPAWAECGGINARQGDVVVLAECGGGRVARWQRRARHWCARSERAGDSAGTRHCGSTPLPARETEARGEAAPTASELEGCRELVAAKLANLANGQRATSANLQSSARGHDFRAAHVMPW